MNETTKPSAPMTIQSRKRRAVYSLNDRQQVAMDDNSAELPWNDPCIIRPPSLQSRSERSNLQRNGNQSQSQQQQKQHKYFCHQCNVGFQRQKGLQEHLNGRKHKKVVAEWQSAAKDYASQAPTWRYKNPSTSSGSGSKQGATGAPPKKKQNQQQKEDEQTCTGHGPASTSSQSLDHASRETIPAQSEQQQQQQHHHQQEPLPQIDETVDVRSSWSATEFRDFPHRSTCIDPSLLIGTISPQLRARFWRYLRDNFGDHYPELAAIFHHVSVRKPQYLRVKELLENLEAFRLVGKIVAQSQKGQPRSVGNDNKNNCDASDGGITDQKTIDVIYDLACGHGLLGILLAYRFPNKRVVCVDWEKRQSFFAFKEAFVAEGEACRDHPIILSNLEYRVADLRSVAPEVTATSCLVAVHACNEANKHVVDMARAVGATWAVMPCCIRSSLYLGGAPVRDVDSQVRYELLCGAFAEANRASVIRSVPRDITARPILIAGGFALPSADREDTNNTAEDHEVKDTPIAIDALASDQRYPVAASAATPAAPAVSAAVPMAPAPPYLEAQPSTPVPLSVVIQEKPPYRLSTPAKVKNAYPLRFVTNTLCCYGDLGIEDPAEKRPCS